MPSVLIGGIEATNFIAKFTFTSEYVLKGISQTDNKRLSRAV
jgi:hypothetical protein